MTLPLVVDVAELDGLADRDRDREVQDEADEDYRDEQRKGHDVASTFGSAAR
jgi:hypothetical protein